jgi:hypothetical protein
MFPRISRGEPQSLETFLTGHRPSGRPLDWAGREMADVVAHLVSHLAGRPVAPRMEQARKENP